MITKKCQCDGEAGEIVCEGFTRAELKEAFDLAMKFRDWKGPINVIIPASGLAVTVAAIGFYTGTSAAVRVSKGGGFRVRSAGYRSGPVRDH